ncbi:hypothetical protein HDF16_002122 [Granulicella aggregans]|uniref:Uncharacterized protein n=1 Tax=Granulicella aggregans TaxID=474949 RepID=A0A7W7ZDM8_9BACT|nr:hypothetical protein [Granulicella aggregans]
MASKSTKESAAKKATVAKKAKAAKKATAVKSLNSATNLPTAEFTADLETLFKKHGWPGLPRRLSFSSMDQCDRICPDGSKATPTWIECPGGPQLVCACPGEDPHCS